ncbi:MAG: GldM family protein, partial [Bacteroidota bacterium]
LVLYLQIYDLKQNIGRINSFNVTRITKEDDQMVTERKLNYGDVFTSEIQSLLRKLKKGDFLLFDNIQVTMIDGTTRNASPLTFKIID